MDTAMASMAMRTEFSPSFSLAGLLICLATSSGTYAQQNVPGAAPTAGTSAAGTPAASRQAGRPNENSTELSNSAKRTWTIQPRISLRETLTDNVSINRAANGKESDLITELTPGIRIEARTNLLKAYFDYALLGQFYAKTDYSRTQNSLNTFGTFEAIDNWLYLDFSGLIAQQSISAFGAQSPSSSTINNNSTETSTYRISPYIRGQFGGTVDYLLRYNQSTTHSQTGQVYDLDLSQWTGQLKGSTVFRNLTWTIDGNQQTADYARGRKTEAELVRAMLTYTVLPQLRLSGSGGWESNNYASLDQETNTTYGYGFDWTPTERTRLSVFKEHRFFGDGHRISFNHRFPMSSITFSDTRDVSVLPNQFATAGLGTNYDLLYPQFSQICNDQLGGTPDQVQIDRCVLELFNVLGIQPNTQVTGGYMTTRATIQRRQQVAFALFGARNSLTFLANRSENQSTLAASAFADDFDKLSSVRQQGVSLTYTHRLSPQSSLNASVSRQESTGGSSGSSLKTTQTLYQLNVSTKLGVKTTGMFSIRRSEFDSNTNPYTENAILGSISYLY